MRDSVQPETHCLCAPQALPPTCCLWSWGPTPLARRPNPPSPSKAAASWAPSVTTFTRQGSPHPPPQGTALFIPQRQSIWPFLPRTQSHQSETYQLFTLRCLPHAWHRPVPCTPRLHSWGEEGQTMDKDGDSNSARGVEQGRDLWSAAGRVGAAFDKVACRKIRRGVKCEIFGGGGFQL